MRRCEADDAVHQVASGDLVFCQSKNGTSSHELGRALGVTQKTKWFMFHRIREAMKTDDGAAFKGAVEADETFVGGKVRTNYFSKSGFRKLQHGPATGKTQDADKRELPEGWFEGGHSDRA